MASNVAVRSIHMCMASRSCSRVAKSICKASKPKIRLWSARGDGAGMGRVSGGDSVEHPMP